MRDMKREDFVASCILKNYKTAECVGDFREVKGICHHSREAEYGLLFVCLRGASEDGHNFAMDAYDRGCRHFLCERALALPRDASYIKVKSVRAHLYGFLSDFFGFRDGDLTLVAVTGTKGKTTTARMLTHVLQKRGYGAACSTTLGITLGDGCLETGNTTPDIFLLSRWLGDLRKKGIRYGIVEVSSAALASGRIFGMPFEIGILTSFSRDHIGKGEHQNMAEYLCAKKSLFSSYGVKTAILPSGVYRGEFIVSDAENIKLLSADADAVSSVEARLNGQAFICENEKMEISMVGEHNRTNARLALCAAAILTGERESVFHPYLKDFSVPGRLEQILHKGVLVVIDYAHNRESLLAVSKAVAGQTQGRRICVFGSVGERGEMRRSDLAEAACEAMDFSVITEDDSGKEDPLHICAQIYAAFSDKTRACIVLNRAEAIRYAFSLCKKGDALLLLGKGHERVLKGKNGAVPFSEKEIVLAL